MEKFPGVSEAVSRTVLTPAVISFTLKMEAACFVEIYETFALLNGDRTHKESLEKYIFMAVKI
jgi:hypothetical protein